MMKLVALLLVLHSASSVRHSLKYFAYCAPGLPKVPDYVVYGMLDGEEVGYCNSNIKILTLRQEWTKRFMEMRPQHLEWYVWRCIIDEHIFRDSLVNLKQRFNQTEGLHILQRMTGCEWDDETGEVDGFNQYAYDGEDFISVDLKSLTWVAWQQKAVVTKNSWNRDIDRLLENRDFYLHQCPENLKMYLDFLKTSQQRREVPSVSLLQRTPSSPVSCFATGFLTDSAMMFWRKDGEELHQDVEMGEILPNHDGTFQMSVHLDISSVRDDEWGSYQCVFHFSSGTDDIITQLDRAAIRTNWVPPSEFPAAALIGGIMGVLVVLQAAAGVFICWRKKPGFSPVKAAPESHPACHTHQSTSST